MSRVKIAEETVFLFFFWEFFRILSENFFRFSAKNLQKVVKTNFCMSRGTICGLNFFLKFWIVLDFLQKPLAWFSNVSLRVQSKNCGRKSFLIYFSEFFRILSEKFFRLLARKLQKVVKTTFCVSRRTICGLNFFLKVLNRFGFSAEPLTWFSNFHLRVQSKNCGRNSFLIFLFRIFSGLWEKKFSDFRPKNFKKLSKLPSTCPEEKFMAWNIF